jgi:hypothetical protein
VRPAQDYDVTVWFSDDGIVWLSVQVVDLSVGGLGLLVSEDLGHKRAGDRLRLRLALPEQESLEMSGVVRHIGSRGICGVQFHEPTESAMAHVRAAVAELLERGHMA